MTLYGFEFQLQRITGLYRKVDLAYPSNRLAVLVSMVSTALVAIISRDVPLAFISGATPFSAWALGRELDPDRPRTANLSAITVGLVLSVLAFSDRLNPEDALLGAIVTGSMMVMTRLMTRSTGLAATTLDAAALVAVALGSGLADPQVAVVLVAIATLGIILERTLEHHPYLANGSWLGYVSFALTALYFLWSSGTWLALTGIVFTIGTLNIVLTSKFTPSSLSDIGTRLEPSRLVVASVLVSLAAIGLASQGMSVALVGLLSVGLWRLWLEP
jgi:hypothetical protein